MIYSQYDLSTGLLTGRYSFCTKPDYRPPDKPGMGWVEGRHDHTQWRVDMETGAVVPLVQG